MTAEQIAAVMADAVGNPSSGPVADAIGAMAKAVADALNPSEASDAAEDEVKPATKGSAKA